MPRIAIVVSFTNNLLVVNRVKFVYSMCYCPNAFKKYLSLNIRTSLREFLLDRRVHTDHGPFCRSDDVKNKRPIIYPGCMASLKVGYFRPDLFFQLLGHLSWPRISNLWDI